MGRGRFKVSRQLIEGWLHLPNNAYLIDIQLDNKTDTYDVYIEHPDIKPIEAIVPEIGYYLTRKQDDTYDVEIVQSNEELAK
jgi:hypothetical protein